MYIVQLYVVPARHHLKFGIYSRRQQRTRAAAGCKGLAHPSYREGLAQPSPASLQRASAAVGCKGLVEQQFRPGSIVQKFRPGSKEQFLQWHGRAMRLSLLAAFHCTGVWRSPRKVISESVKNKPIQKRIFLANLVDNCGQ